MISSSISGVDTVRYYVLHEIPFKCRMETSPMNFDRAKQYGSCQHDRKSQHRTIGMANKYRNGFVKRVILDEPFELELQCAGACRVAGNGKSMKVYVAEVNSRRSCEVARHANKYIDVSEPWETLEERGSQGTGNTDHILSSHRNGPFRRGAPTAVHAIRRNGSRNKIGFDDMSFESLEFGLLTDRKLGTPESSSNAMIPSRNWTRSSPIVNGNLKKSRSESAMSHRQ